MLKPCLFNITFQGKQQQQQKQQRANSKQEQQEQEQQQSYNIILFLRIFFCQFKFHNYCSNRECNTHAGRQVCGKHPTMCIKLNKNCNYVLCACQENSSESDK